MQNNENYYLETVEFKKYWLNLSMKKSNVFSTILFLILPYLLYSQDIVYKPMNPFFGGDTFNYQQMLASANAQNSFEEDAGFDFKQASDLENFSESLNRQLLNSLSQDLYQDQFGNEALTEGTYVFGSLVVEISPTSGGLSVSILDTITGEQTQIIIPN
ncbi:curli production assembly/transport component CsgF [Lutibacter agarilyticus]|uniref:Curli production assembly/transport component CsgF n=1 Tax=Lutibacter agarilyticus TaxID=1109740 RepID=A0A238YS28_9FLAO|nr:curli production assembly/transport component CsgF [Lutibacter agarilyticus]SNR73945.1 curli production assembly/transport component CsgF [Lutibacter agarilyticus]